VSNKTPLDELTSAAWTAALPSAYGQTIKLVGAKTHGTAETFGSGLAWCVASFCGFILSVWTVVTQQLTMETASPCLMPLARCCAGLTDLSKASP